MPRKSLVEIQTTETATSSPLRRSTRLSSNPTSTPSAIGTRRDSQTETKNDTPARVTRRKSVSQEPEEKKETKPAPRTRRASALTEEEVKKPTSTPTRLSRKSSSTEFIEEKPKSVRGRRSSVNEQSSDKEQKPLSTRNRRASVDSEASAASTLKTPKKATRSRKNSSEAEGSVEETISTRNRKKSATEEEESRPKSASRRGRKSSTDKDNESVTESVTEKEENQPKSVSRRGRKSSTDKDYESVNVSPNKPKPNDAIHQKSPSNNTSTAEAETPSSTTPRKKARLFIKVDADLDLSVINESTDDANTSKLEKSLNNDKETESLPSVIKTANEENISDVSNTTENKTPERSPKTKKKSSSSSEDASKISPKSQKRPSTSPGSTPRKSPRLAEKKVKISTLDQIIHTPTKSTDDLNESELLKSSPESSGSNKENIGKNEKKTEKQTIVLLSNIESMLDRLKTKSIKYGAIEPMDEDSSMSEIMNLCTDKSMVNLSKEPYDTEVNYIIEETNTTVDIKLNPKHNDNTSVSIRVPESSDSNEKKTTKIQNPQKDDKQDNATLSPSTSNKQTKCLNQIPILTDADTPKEEAVNILGIENLKIAGTDDGKSISPLKRMNVKDGRANPNLKVVLQDNIEFVLRNQTSPSVHCQTEREPIENSPRQTNINKDKKQPLVQDQSSTDTRNSPIKKMNEGKSENSDKASNKKSESNSEITELSSISIAIEREMKKTPDKPIGFRLIWSPNTTQTSIKETEITHYDFNIPSEDEESQEDTGNNKSLKMSPNKSSLLENENISPTKKFQNISDTKMDISEKSLAFSKKSETNSKDDTAVASENVQQNSQGSEKTVEPTVKQDFVTMDVEEHVDDTVSKDVEVLNESDTGKSNGDQSENEKSFNENNKSDLEVDSTNNSVDESSVDIELQLNESIKDKTSLCESFNKKDLQLETSTSSYNNDQNIVDSLKQNNTQNNHSPITEVISVDKSNTAVKEQSSVEQVVSENDKYCIDDSLKGNEDFDNNEHDNNEVEETDLETELTLSTDKNITSEKTENKIKFTSNSILTITDLPEQSQTDPNIIEDHTIKTPNKMQLAINDQEQNRQNMIERKDVASSIDLSTKEKSILKHANVTASEAQDLNEKKDNSEQIIESINEINDKSSYVDAENDHSQLVESHVHETDNPTLSNEELDKSDETERRSISPKNIQNSSKGVEVVDEEKNVFLSSVHAEEESVKLDIKDSQAECENDESNVSNEELDKSDETEKRSLSSKNIQNSVKGKDMVDEEQDVFLSSVEAEEQSVKVDKKDIQAECENDESNLSTEELDQSDETEKRSLSSKTIQNSVKGKDMMDEEKDVFLSSVEAEKQSVKLDQKDNQAECENDEANLSNEELNKSDDPEKSSLSSKNMVDEEDDVFSSSMDSEEEPVELDIMTENVQSNLSNDTELDGSLDSSDVQMRNQLLPETIDNTETVKKLNDLSTQLDDYINSMLSDDDNSEEERRVSYNDFIDDLAEEGEEDTPSEDSNQIIDDGESIGSTDHDDHESEDEYENDSFICDDEQVELLSGNEDYLASEPKKKSKGNKSRIIPSEDLPDDEIINISKENVKNIKKKSRIIRVSTSSSEEDRIELIAPLPEQIANDTSENDRNYPVNEKPTSSVIKPVTIDLTNSDSPKKTDKCVGNQARRSSLNIQESIVLNGSKDTSLSTRINTLVDTFCSSVAKGEVAVNISLEYEEKPKKLLKEKNMSITETKEIVSSNVRLEEHNSTDDEIVKELGISVDQVSDLRELIHQKAAKRRLSQSMDDLRFTEAKKRKTKKMHPEGKTKKSKKNSSKNKQHTSFNMIDQLLTDVKNRPRRTIKPSQPINEIIGPWKTSKVANLKPSTSPVSKKELTKIVKGKLHPKDFKNQMLADSSRNPRISTKSLLRKKGVFS